MKILAIRGCNLASLAGEFEIDLSRGALGSAGVFAIVGNTGAGKSTLLDALCVALFDRTPRLTNHSTVKVGRGEERALLGAQDVRTLLRRGTAKGWAEVDFEASDGQRFRSRWSVRRARDQSDGTLQDEQLVLTGIESGERLGGTKTETLKAIHQRLGLSFDQFRRSALLAQGEFAAFLRADGKDRSELLERMTGTEIYSRLSIAAHVKAALAEQKLRDGRTAALAIGVLDDGARRDAEAQLAIANDAKLAARARHAAADAAARWVAEAARRAAQLAAAATEHQAARGAAIAAEPDRAELVLRRRAEQLRPRWDAANRSERALAIARGEAAQAGEAVERAIAALAAIGARRDRLAVMHAPIREARLAARIVEHTLGRTGAPAPRTDDVEALVRAAEADAAWLAPRAALAGEIAAWSELDGRLARYTELEDALAGLDRALAEHGETRSKLARSHELLVAEHRAAGARHVETQHKVAGYQQRRGLTLDAARRAEDEARTQLAEAERLVAIADAARSAITARDEIARQLAELAQAIADDRDHAARLTVARDTAHTVRKERARIVDELRRAAGYEHARAELAEGEPCPLCGALEHPWRERGALDDVIADAEARLAEVLGELDGFAANLAAIAARSSQHEREQQRLERHRATAADTARAAVATWRDQLRALGELVFVDDPASPAAATFATDRHALAKRKLEEARTTRLQTEAATKAAQDANAEMLLAKETVDQLAHRLADLARRIGEQDAAIERVRGERASKLEQHATLATELATTIARWTGALPVASRAADRAAIDPRREAGGAGRAIDPSVAVALVEHVQASVAARAIADAMARAGASRAGDAPSTIAIIRAALSALVETWREHAERVAHADAALAASLVAIEQTARDADRAVAETTARKVDAERRRDNLNAELATAHAELEAARATAGFAADELHRLLAADPSRVDALAERLAALDRAIDRTRAVVAERERLVAEHAAARPAHVADAAEVDALAAQVTAADHEAARLIAVIAADDDARIRRAAALATVAADEASAEVDRILGDVIGSHDGKLFRSFAQSLTLDSLLAVANAHLEELAPRYQLERVPRHDLELQVIDRDMGSEIRSVQSLSGGESFLVSLALALGLSSMSAHDVRVRTLLIDEGFGTLDPSTLDAALSVLDALQATGRQVGVISHVPALVERVGAHVRVVQRGGGRSEVIVS